MKKRWFENSVVIITGASSGIGKLLATYFLKHNCTVLAIARNLQNLQKTKEQLGEKYICFSFDVSIKQNWENFKNYLTENNIQPDILINNAGYLPKFENFENQTSNDVENVLNVNFLSNVYSIESLLPLIKKSKNGGIINISSSACLSTVIGTCGYSASKSALKSFTESLILENKDLYVALVMPGFTKTNILKNQDDDKKNNTLINKVSSDPEKITKKIFNKIIRKKSRIIVGYDAHLMNTAYKIMPQTTNKLIAKIISKHIFGK